MLENTRLKQAAYQRDVKNFQASRKVLKKQLVLLRHALDMNRLELKIKKTRHSMTDNWTTLGLKTNMQALFENMRQDMQVVTEQSDQMRKLIRSIYMQFQKKHGFVATQPKMFSIMRHRVDLDLLFQEAEIFRKSPVTTMTEKHFVVKRFFVAMVSRARDIFFQARQEVNAWMKVSLEPLIYEIHIRRDEIDQHMLDLEKIGKSRDTLRVRIAELENQHNSVAQDLTRLRNMHSILNNLQPLVGEEPPRPRLISQNTA